MIDLKDFKGAAVRLDAIDIPRLAHRINVSEDHLRAFMKVEAGSRPYDRQGRPVMLFEPHVFYRALPEAKQAEAVAKGLAYPSWRPGQYPADSYPRLIEAIKIDEDAALKACSIGISQVLVENHSQVGFKTPQAMWQAFMDDEEEHVEAMIRFILANGIDDDLRAERWETVARVYNGPRYRENAYHTKMAQAFAEFRRQADVVWEPDKADPARLSISDADALKAVQTRLIELGYPEVGKPDGAWGSKTRAAVLGFRADHGLPIVADIDADLMMALMLAPKRPVGEVRANTTAADLRAAGSRPVIAADKASFAGLAVTVGGVLTGISEATSGLSDTVSGVNDQLSQVQTLFDMVKPLLDSAMSISPILLLGLGAYIIYQQVRVKQVVTENYREGKYLGR